MLQAFREWLRLDVQRYLQEKEIPDLWTQMGAHNSYWFDSTIWPLRNSNQEDEAFTEDEKRDVRQSIRRFRVLIIEQFKPSHKQSEFIDEKLDYLTKAVDRLNRFDWRCVALATIITIGANLTVDTTKGQALLELFKQAFGSARHFLP